MSEGNQKIAVILFIFSSVRFALAVIEARRRAGRSNQSAKVTRK
jgi:hypothetical protein